MLCFEILMVVFLCRKQWSSQSSAIKWMATKRRWWSMLVESFEKKVPFLFSFSINFHWSEYESLLLILYFYLSYWLEINQDFLGLQNQVLTALLQTPNYRQQCQVLRTQNQEAVLTQALACTPNSQTFTAPGNSTKCNSQNPKISRTEPSNKDREVCLFLSNQLIFQKTFVPIGMSEKL